MKYYLTLFSAILMLNVCSQSLESLEADAFIRDIGEEGTLFFEIYPVSNKYSKLELQAKKMAVYTVLFLGIENKNKNMPSFPPYFKSKDILTSKKEFFKKFFAKNGPYLNYVSLVGTQGQFELIKVRGKGWKMGFNVSVYHLKLYDDLKKYGIIEN